MDYATSPESRILAAERLLLDKLDNLFVRWRSSIHNLARSHGLHDSDFVTDGFHPYYLNQNVKILFVGRESRGISGCDNMRVLFQAYKNKRIGKQHINSNLFHKRMLYIAYGLNNGMCDWTNDIPYADIIAEKFGTSNGISFAFMNLSKFSNESDEWQSNWSMIGKSADASNSGVANYIHEEISILSPDLIITMNLGEHLPVLGAVTPITPGKPVGTYWYNESARKTLLLDTFHFTALKKHDINDFYAPICDAMREHAPQLCRPIGR